MRRSARPVLAAITVTPRPSPSRLADAAQDITVSQVYMYLKIKTQKNIATNLLINLYS